MIKAVFESCPFEHCISTQGITQEQYRSMSSTIIEVLADVNADIAEESHITFAEIVVLLAGFGGDVDNFNVRRLLLDKTMYRGMLVDDFFPEINETSDFAAVVRYIVLNLKYVYVDDVNGWKSISPTKLPQEWFRGSLTDFSKKYVPSYIVLTDRDLENKAVVLRMMRVEGFFDAMYNVFGDDVLATQFRSFESLENSGNEYSLARRQWIIDSFITLGGGIPRETALRIGQSLQIAMRANDNELRVLHNSLNKHGRPSYDQRALRGQIQRAEKLLGV